MNIRSVANSEHCSEAAQKELDTNVMLAGLGVKMGELAEQLSEASKENKELRDMLQALEVVQSPSKADNIDDTVSGGARASGLTAKYRAAVAPTSAQDLKSANVTNNIWSNGGRNARVCGGM